MSLQNHNTIWLNQRLQELKSEYPSNAEELNVFKIWAKNLVEFYDVYDIDLWVDSVYYKNDILHYSIKAQPQPGYENSPWTLELLKRLEDA